MKFILFLITILSTHNIYAQHIVPTPKIIDRRAGSFVFPDKVKIFVQDENAYYLNYLKERVLAERSFIHTSREKADILFLADTSLEKEGYILDVKPKKVKIIASDAAGFLYAVVSLAQLRMKDHPNKIQSLYVEDAPRHKWRSFMLDAGRQFQSIATVKKYLDMMTLLKMNIFHWHLTEGLGWRLEIRKYPALTNIGAFVSDGPEQQGYYTQEDVKEIIRYAAMRNITVVPEIDMPGHAEAAISACPQLSCFGEPGVLDGKSFSENIFCASKPSTAQFLKNLLDEVCALFPSKYIHLGGDEAPKGNWDKCPYDQAIIKKEGLKDSDDLQRYFSAQIANYLKSKGRKVIFWDDMILKDGYPLPDNIVIQWWNWRGHRDKAFKQALKSGHEVICGTNYYSYLNFPVSPWRGYKANRTFDMKDVYQSNPSMNKEGNPLVLGMSSALWTDYGVLQSMIDKRLFPRIFALAEQMWHKGQYMPFDAFYKEVNDKKPYFEGMGYEFGPGLRSEVPPNYPWD